HHVPAQRLEVVAAALVERTPEGHVAAHGLRAHVPGLHVEQLDLAAHRGGLQSAGLDPGEPHVARDAGHVHLPAEPGPDHVAGHALGVQPDPGGHLEGELHPGIVAGVAAAVAVPLAGILTLPPAALRAVPA